MSQMVSHHPTFTEASRMGRIHLREVASSETGTYVTRAADLIPKEEFSECLVIYMSTLKSGNYLNA